MTMTSESLWQPEQQQQLFRQLMQAMAYPGRCQALTDSEVPAERAVLATLVAPGVSLCDRHTLLPESDWPLLEAQRSCDAEAADFVLADGVRAPDFTPRTGSLAEPEKSATVILRATTLGTGDTRLRLTGPGIREHMELALTGLHSDWLRQREAWVASFPMGADLILADARQIVALPRTTRVEMH
jgi:alpha-D-ribose 1-methylphosphonate 5-triphosphate synthase subunit PhnH